MFRELRLDPIALPLTEAVRVSGLSRSEIYRLMAAEKLTGLKSNNRTLVTVESIKAHLASLPRATFRKP